jgi:hypothetical protein
VPHLLRDREERHAGSGVPVPEGASEVVRARPVDLRSLARCRQVPADVAPGLEERLALAGGVPHRVLEERPLHRADDRDGAEARLALRAAQQDRPQVERGVVREGELGLAPARGRGDDERSAGGSVRRQLGEELREFLGWEEALPRLVAGGERYWDDLLDAAAPQAGAQGETERLAEDGQLLGDGGVRRPLHAPLRDVRVDLWSAEVREREPHACAVPRLEHPDEVARLAFVELLRVRAAPPCADLLLVEAQQEL